MEGADSEIERYNSKQKDTIANRKIQLQTATRKSADSEIERYNSKQKDTIANCDKEDC